MSDIITRRKHTETRKNLKKMEADRVKKQKMRQFLEMEAELGSENEDHDERIKDIDADDAEENEEG